MATFDAQLRLRECWRNKRLAFHAAPDFIRVGGRFALARPARKPGRRVRLAVQGGSIISSRLAPIHLFIRILFLIRCAVNKEFDEEA